MPLFVKDDDLIAVVLLGALSVSFGLVAAALFLRKKRVEVDSEIHEKKQELVRDHLSHLKERAGAADLPDLDSHLNPDLGPDLRGELISHVKTTSSPLPQQEDPAQIADLGNSLCKIDEGCRALLDFAQTLCSFQEFNDQVLFYGALPIAAVAIISLGGSSASGSGPGPGAGDGAGSRGGNEVEKRLKKLEKQAAYELKLDERVEKLERLYV